MDATHSLGVNDTSQVVSKFTGSHEEFRELTGYKIVKDDGPVILKKDSSVQISEQPEDAYITVVRAAGGSGNKAQTIMPVDQPGLPGNREKPTDEETPVPDEPATPTPVPPSSEPSEKTPELSTNADFAEGSHEVVANSTVVDTVTYEGLVPGKQYTLSAELISKADGKTVLGKGEKTFTPAESAGTEDVTITVNDDVTEPVEAAVAFEELTSTEVNDKGEDTPDVEKPNKVAEHKDITDKDQTVTSKGSKKTPQISTNADFAEGSHEIVAGAEIIDAVSYEGLVPGKQYTLSAELISKADGKTVLGKGEKTFTPAESAGTEDVTITVNDDVTEPVEAAVAFEELTSTEVNDKGEDTPDVEKPNKVAEHKDITDKDQTVTSKGSKKTPQISTNADFAEGSHEIVAGAEIIDAVSYEGLVPGKQYTLSAELISKADGKTVLGKVEKTFTPEKSEGSVDVEITVDSDVTEPVEAAVAFEELTSTEVNDKGEDTPDVEKPNKVAEHKDIDDEDQTVTSKGSKKTPEISTNADFAEGSHEVIAGAEIIDTVSYEGLVPGKEYTLSAELISKKDGTTVLGKGEKTFTPAAANGTEDVTITVNDDVTEPVEAAVAFEELTSTEVNDKGEDTPDAEQPNKVAEHKDIDDKDQTVTSEECDNPGDKPNKGKIPWWAILIPGIGLGKIIHDHRHEGDHDQPKDHHKDHSKGSNASEQQSKGNGDNHTPGKTGEHQPGDAGQSAQDHVPGKTGTPLPADAGRTEIKSVPSGATELDPGVQGYIK